MTIDIDQNEFYLIWDSVNKNTIAKYAETRKKGIEAWRKKNLQEDIKDLKKLQDFFTRVDKKIKLGFV